MDVRQVLATNLRRLRRERGLSQEEMAFRAKINRSYASKLETGATWAGLEIIAKIAGVLDVEPADLLIRPRRSVYSASTRLNGIRIGNTTVAGSRLQNCLATR